MQKLHRNIVRIQRDPFVLRQFNNCMSRVHTRGQKGEQKS